MKKLLILLVTAACLLAVSSVPAEEEAAADPGSKITMDGEYHWTGRDMTGPVKAELTPAGENRWEVSFYFQFRDKPHTYTGIAEGSLTSGSLKGEVQNENKKRTFTFTGSVEDGRFEGTHAEIHDGAVRDTGTITLSLNR